MEALSISLGFWLRNTEVLKAQDNSPNLDFFLLNYVLLSRQNHQYAAKGSRKEDVDEMRLVSKKENKKWRIVWKEMSFNRLLHGFLNCKDFLLKSFLYHP